MPAWRRRLWQASLDALVHDEPEVPLSSEDRSRVRGLRVEDVLGGILGHWQGETLLGVLAWPWRLFCAQWVVLLEYSWDETLRQRDRDDERAAQEQEREREQTWDEQRLLQDRMSSGG